MELSDSAKLRQNKFNHIRQFSSRAVSKILSQPSISQNRPVFECFDAQVHLCNFSQNRNPSLMALISKLLDRGVVFCDQASPSVLDLLLTSKVCSEVFCCTVGVRSVERNLVKYWFAVQVMERKLPMISGSRFYAKFNFRHVCWQLLLH